MHQESQNLIDGKMDSLSEVLASEATEARCCRCGVTEWVVPLDMPNDEVFLVNYHCDDCDRIAP